MIMTRKEAVKIYKKIKMQEFKEEIEYYLPLILELIGWAFVASIVITLLLINNEILKIVIAGSILLVALIIIAIFSILAIKEKLEEREECIKELQKRKTNDYEK